MTERLHGTDNLGDAEDRKRGGPDLGHSLLLKRHIHT